MAFIILTWLNYRMPGEALGIIVRSTYRKKNKNKNRLLIACINQDRITHSIRRGLCSKGGWAMADRNACKTNILHKNGQSLPASSLTVIRLQSSRDSMGEVPGRMRRRTRQKLYGV